MISRRSIFQAMNATGVLGNVPANGARRLARRIGHIVKTVRRDGAREVRINQSGLHHRQTIFYIDL